MMRFALRVVLAVSGAAAAGLPVEQGIYDNRDQTAKSPRDADSAIPQVTLTIEPTPQKDFALWHVHLQTDAESTYEQTWAMQSRTEYDGSTSLIDS